MLKTTSSVINASQIATPITLPGDVTLSTGNLVIATAGKGVEFSANTPAAGMTSQLLNWYEEGTFTPTMFGGATAGTTTYDFQNGAYVRVGRLVTFQIQVGWSNATGTGAMKIGGLPFTSSATIQNGACTVWANNITFTAGAYLTYVINTNATSGVIYESANGAVVGNVAVDTSGSLIINGSYMV